MLNSSETTNDMTQSLTTREIVTNKCGVLPYFENRSIVQNFVLIWLDSNLNQIDNDHSNFISQLQQTVSTIKTFVVADQCVDFITNIKDEKVFMLVSDTLAEQIIRLIHDMPQLYAVYVFGENKFIYENRTYEWIKMKGTFTQIESICDSLKRDTKQCDHDMMPISIVSPGDYSKRDLNELEPSFMYSQILKEILLDIDHDEHAKKELVQLWREHYCENGSMLKIIDEFEQNYNSTMAITWYTKEVFTYSMLNRALRTMDTNVLIKMGFFLRDLHRQIERLHIVQSDSQVPITVYRGQAMNVNEFEKLRNSKGGLLSFNNFLSTSLDPEVAQIFCPISPEDLNVTAVLFKITINPTLVRTPFAVLKDVSHFSDAEMEVLFSMHTVFRIGDSTSLKDHFWHGELILTSNDDAELKQLTERMREETGGPTGWYRLGKLLFRIGNFDKTEELYQTLLKETNEDDWKQFSYLHHQLGVSQHTIEEITKTHSSLIGRRSESSQSFSIRTIQIWHSLMVTWLQCIVLWENTRNHSSYIRKLLKFNEAIFLRAIRIWLLPTATSLRYIAV